MVARLWRRTVRGLATVGGRVARGTWRALVVAGELLVAGFIGVFYVIGFLPSLAVASVRLGWVDGKRGGRAAD